MLIIKKLELEYLLIACTLQRGEGVVRPMRTKHMNSAIQNAYKGGGVENIHFLRGMYNSNNEPIHTEVYK